MNRARIRPLEDQIYCGTREKWVQERCKRYHNRESFAYNPYTSRAGQWFVSLLTLCKTQSTTRDYKLVQSRNYSVRSTVERQQAVDFYASKF